MSSQKHPLNISKTTTQLIVGVDPRGQGVGLVGEMVIDTIY